MDRIIALFKSPLAAKRAFEHLSKAGVPADRLEIVSLDQREPLRHLRDQTFAEDLFAYYHVLLRERGDWPTLDRLADSIQRGKATLVVRARSRIDINRIRPILEAHAAERIYWRSPEEEESQQPQRAQYAQVR